MKQFDPNLEVEWSFQNTNTQSCTLNPDGSVTCVSDHPDGFEWCINAVIVDADGGFYGYFTSNRIHPKRTEIKVFRLFIDNADEVNEDLERARDLFCGE